MMINNCNNCAAAAKMSVKSTLRSCPTPANVWECVHIDYAGPIEGFYFLLVVNEFSKCPEIIETKLISLQQTVKMLSEIFALFGLPSTLVSEILCGNIA